MGTWTVRARVIAPDNWRYGANALFALVVRDSYVVTLRDLRICRLAPGNWITGYTAQLGPPNLIAIRSITDVFGGTSITPAAHDSANDALPSQLTAVLDPANVTLTNSNPDVVIRRQGDTLGWTDNSATLPASAFIGWIENPRAIRNPNFSGPWYARSEVAGSPIVIRAGEGIAIGTSGGAAANLPNSAGRKDLTITFRNTANGQCWTIYTPYVSTVAGHHDFALMNASGSGVTYEIVEIKFHCRGRMEGTNNQPIFDTNSRLLVVNDISNGTDVTPIAFDTADGAFPSSSVLIQTNARITSCKYFSEMDRFIGIASDGGATNSYQSLGTALNGTQLGNIPQVFGAPLTRYVPKDFHSPGPAKNLDVIIYQSSKGEPGWVIRRGDGIALCYGSLGGANSWFDAGLMNISPLLAWDVQATFNLYPSRERVSRARAALRM